MTPKETIWSRSKISPAAIATAPGKVILTGEHFVVLGSTALSMAIDLYSTAQATRNNLGNVEVEATIPIRLIGQREREKLVPRSLLRPLETAAEATIRFFNKSTRNGALGANVNVECEIPIGAGLGSSAATGVSIIAAVAASQGRNLSKREIFKLAYAPERLVHTHPSGIDQATTTYGGIIQYRKGNVEAVSLHYRPKILVCDSGIHRSTGKLVDGVVSRSKNQLVKADYLEKVKEANEITLQARRALEDEDDLALGELMNRNQDLLAQIGVSHPKLDRLIQVANRSGALGSKLTGAGGGGCIIALCENSTSQRIVSRSLARAGGIVYDTRLSKDGVQVTKY